MDMAERIKERRISMGFTQEELGEKLGLQKSAIAKYENGRVENIKRSVIANMAKVLECSPAYLMGWEDNPSSNKDTSIVLSPKDDRDIAKDLDRIMGEIRKGDDGPLYYNGVEIDSASINLLQNAIEFALRETKKENKVKYNPNKNKSR